MNQCHSVRKVGEIVNSSQVLISRSEEYYGSKRNDTGRDEWTGGGDDEFDIRSIWLRMVWWDIQRVVP